MSDPKLRPATFAETLEAIGCSHEARQQAIRKDVWKVLEGRRSRAREGTATLNRGLIELLRTCDMWATVPPKELIDAIAQQLGVAGPPRNSPRDKAKLQKAIQLLVDNPNLSHKKLARESGLSLPTVIRLTKPKSPFMAEVQFASEIPSLKERGLCKELSEVKSRRQFFVEEAVPKKFYVEESS